MSFSSEHQDYNRAVNPLLFNTRQGIGDKSLGVPQTNGGVAFQQTRSRLTGEKLAENNNQNQKGGQTKMATLKEEAMAYEPPQTLNIADLDSVPINLQLYDSEEKMDKDGKPFTYKYFELNGKDYRVPASVLEEIQTILKLKPTVTKIKVKKSGSGLGTRYKVEALD